MEKEMIWKSPNQDITSSDTSVSNGRPPATFRLIPWKAGTRNADIGGGRYEAFTVALNGIGVENLIYDPFNRSPEHNAFVVSKIRNHQCETCTVNSVLNVIRDRKNRKVVILQALNAIKKTGTAYFLVYEGDKSGIGKRTTKGWQNNRKTSSYLKEIRSVFNKAARKGCLIIATP